MKFSRKLIVAAACVLLPTLAAAQEKPAEKPKPAEAPKAEAARAPEEQAPRASRSAVAYRLHITVVESDGSKITANLPYVLNGTATTEPPAVSPSIRMGIRVPIQTSPTQIQYQNIGTDIDSWGRVLEPGRLIFKLFVRRSSVRFSEPVAGEPPAREASGQPIIQEFNGASEFILRDGQSTQLALATDPVSGRVLKVEAKLELLKP